MAVEGLLPTFAIQVEAITATEARLYRIEQVPIGGLTLGQSHY
jgi:hypothetical protein